MAHVVNNLHEDVPEDESRDDVRRARAMRALIEQKALGNKTDAGFYKRVKATDGATNRGASSTRSTCAPCSMSAPAKPRFDVIGETKGLDLPERMRVIFDRFGADRGGKFIIDTTLPILAYAARRIPEIADSIADVDNAMRWGFNAEAGPFEIWDVIGVRHGREMMRAREIAVPEWVDGMLAAASSRSTRSRTAGASLSISPPSTPNPNPKSQIENLCCA